MVLKDIKKLTEQALSYFNLSSFCRCKVTNNLVKVYLLYNSMFSWNEGQVVHAVLRFTRSEVTVEKGKISYFGLARKFNSTLNFTQSGWLILFSPDLHFRLANRIRCQTPSLWLENADQCRRHTGRSSIAMLFSWTMPPSTDILLRL